MYAIELLAYTSLGSGEQQPWNSGYPRMDECHSDSRTPFAAEETPLNIRNPEGKANYTVEATG